jgi:outer membrane protein assembly factor BamB
VQLACTPHILRDIASGHEDLGADEYGRTVSDQDLLRNRVAFTSLLYQPADELLYCGITAYDADIFYTFDPDTSSFTSLGWQEVGEQFDVKIHRSLCAAPDGKIYGATAGLHDITRRLEAPGGKVFSYDPATGDYEILCTPSPPDYVQTITLDPERRLIYGFTYPVFKLFKYDLDADQVTDFDYIGSITHLSALDDEGKLWGTWHPRSHNLFCYDPDGDEITWFQHSVPNAREGSDIMYPGAGPVDCMINGGDGFIYIGTTLGALVRLDPKTAKVDYLGKPFPEQRMPGLCIGEDGLIYGCGGDGGAGQLFTYDRESGAFHLLGPVTDGSDACYRTHDLALVGDRIFVAETDNPQRSGWLWECALKP